MFCKKVVTDFVLLAGKFVVLWKMCCLVRDVSFEGF